eukprot:symbB.v1.2.031126.t1/scaffold3576.1/size53854/4
MKCTWLSQLLRAISEGLTLAEAEQQLAFEESQQEDDLNRKLAMRREISEGSQQITQDVQAVPVAPRTEVTTSGDDQLTGQEIFSTLHIGSKTPTEMSNMALRLCTTPRALSAPVQEQRLPTGCASCSNGRQRSGKEPAGSGPGRLTATLLGVSIMRGGRRRSRGHPLRSSADAVWPLPEEDKKTLKQVVIVHRHGTRFPTKPSGPGNLGWPVRAQFWDSYKGHLTPLGAKLLTDTGIVLRKRYISNGSCLFDGVQKVDGRSVAVYTSNVQRTLQSAWSLLLGLVPGASIFFAFRSERVFAQALKQAVGVPIYVEDASSGDDRLFHEWKLNKEAYKTWKKENLKKSDFLNYAKDAPEYNELLDTLFERLQEPKLGNNSDEWRRLLAAKDVDTQVLIEQSHNRPILPNELGEELSDKEQEMLRKIGDEVKRCWFGDAEGDFSRSYGKQAAGYLGHKIWRHLDERAKDLCHQRFVQFSCHDTTMCALAAHFGIELEKIGFGAFFALELHEKDGSDFIKFYYNPTPDLGAPSYEGLKSLVLPLGKEEKIRPLKDLHIRFHFVRRRFCRLPTAASMGCSAASHVADESPRTFHGAKVISEKELNLEKLDMLNSWTLGVNTTGAAQPPSKRSHDKHILKLDSFLKEVESNPSDLVGRVQTKRGDLAPKLCSQMVSERI